MWDYIIDHGLSKSDQMAHLEQYKFPENCTSLIPPNINPEILPILSNASVNKDDSYIQFPKSLGCGLSGLGKGINLVLDYLLICLSD